MKNQRRKHAAEFKTRVALEAIKGLETINQIAAKYELHPVQVGNWKKELLEGAGSLFDRKNAKDDTDQDRRIEELQRKVGQLSMEVDFLEKKSVQLGIAGRGRRL